MSSSSFDAKAAAWDSHPDRVARAEAVARALFGRLPADLAGPALDFGCGTGLLGAHLASRFAPVVFADPSEGMRAEALKKLNSWPPGRGLVMDPSAGSLGAALPPGTGYAVAASLMTFHHIDEPAREVRRLAAALAPGGWLALADLDEEDGGFHGAEAVPHRGFDRVVVQGWCLEAGLKVTSSTTPWVNRRDVGGAERLFPVFLVLAQKPLA